MKNLIFVIIFLVICSVVTANSFISNYDYSNNHSSTFEKNNDLNKIEDQNNLLTPCCNNLDPRSTTGPSWSINCSGREVQIDSLCCVNIWNYYNGSPPSPISCNTVDVLCPETLH